MNDQALLDERALSKLKWRCRRGLLENDLFIERFFEARESRLTVREARGLAELMELADNDLLELLLGRRDAAASGLAEETIQVLEMLRRPTAPSPVVGKSN
ncbi:MAG TPA: succinate dehydrogenase assembly factor 2 [Ramlibacter sp.]|uniref:FAD assembly factor SdhE n=1 Tax=Ramlibacter sp. TaxID=1917967 RepID=UPI002CF18BC8|nr:succinate dehydrogenase assembly factor 2 [Ramlibacter sp.]HVZ46092.1 succinate dehydrogenase assembly factor 2 [Ramlibacter sp.]